MRDAFQEYVDNRHIPNETKRRMPQNSVEGIKPRFRRTGSAPECMPTLMSLTGEQKECQRARHRTETFRTPILHVPPRRVFAHEHVVLLSAATERQNASQTACRRLPRQLFRYPCRPEGELPRPNISYAAARLQYVRYRFFAMLTYSET